MSLGKKLVGWFYDEEPETKKEKEENTPALRNVDNMSNDNVDDVARASAIVATADIVTQAYEAFGDSKFDIFNVEELYANFEGIPESTKNDLIRKNLVTLHVDLVAAIGEAKSRKESIAKVSQEHQAESEKIGEEIASHIRDAKALIDQLSAQDIERKNKLEAELEGARAELARLDEIIRILGGE